MFAWKNTDLQQLGNLIRPQHPDIGVSGVTANITTGATTDVLAAAGAALYWVLTSILVTNAHASQGTWVKIVEETTGTILWRGYAAPGGGGFSSPFPGQGLTQGTANKKIQAICETAGAEVCVNILAYKAGETV